jgi:hypothetical protein
VIPSLATLSDPRELVSINPPDPLAPAPLALAEPWKFVATSLQTITRPPSPDTVASARSEDPPET